MCIPYRWATTRVFLIFAFFCGFPLNSTLYVYYLFMYHVKWVFPFKFIMLYQLVFFCYFFFVSACTCSCFTEIKCYDFCSRDAIIVFPFDCSVTNNGNFINNEFNDVYLVTTVAPIPLEAFTLEVKDNSVIVYFGNIYMSIASSLLVLVISYKGFKFVYNFTSVP